MIRNLIDYQKNYNVHPYERFQVFYRKRKVIEVLEKYPHNRILEVGCGLEPLFMDNIDFERIIVVEPVDLFYKNALDKLETFDRKDKVIIYNGLLEDTVENLKGFSFDYIMLSGIMHELPNPSDFLQKIHSICSNETIIHINVPNAKSFHRLLGLEMGIIQSEFDKSDANVTFQQFSVFDLLSLKNLVLENGFEVIEEGSYFFKPFTHQQMENLINANVINESVIEGLYNMEKHISNLGSEIYINIRLAKK